MGTADEIRPIGAPYSSRGAILKAFTTKTMEIDKITYEDLSLFSHEEEYSIFHKLDFTRTTGGKDLLLEYFNTPFSRLEPILGTQQVLALILGKIDQWPSSI